MAKHLLEIANQLQNKEIYGDVNILIEDVSADSRDIKVNGLFIALRGARVDGHNYLENAVKAGARALVVDTLPKKLPDNVAVILVSDTREAMEIIAPYFYDYPGKKLRMVGVTGTNGKTTTTNIVRQVLEKAGHKVGMIGTINIVIGDRVLVSHNTTPDVVDLQKALAEMVACGCDYCVMEVSSHALALKRVSGIEYDCAVLTNITQDHLDFHKTMENYRDAKSLLFENLHTGAKPNKMAVFNMDDASSEIIKNRTKTNVLTYGMQTTYDIHPENVKIHAKGMDFVLHTPKGKMNLTTKITGAFNVYNIMSAVCVLLAEGVDLSLMEKEINAFVGVPGRFQLVEKGQDFTVVVDYAHTPDGLENVLHTAREITKNNLWVIFGCGGDRDNTKRPIMGRIARELADKIVVTSDNPRTEDPDKILDQICVAFEGMQDKEFHRIADRREAIEFVLQNAVHGDVVMIAGKGHEDYQILKDKTIHFSDKEVVEEYLENVKSR